MRWCHAQIRAYIGMRLNASVNIQQPVIFWAGCVPRPHRQSEKSGRGVLKAEEKMWAKKEKRNSLERAFYNI